MGTIHKIKKKIGNYFLKKKLKDLSRNCSFAGFEASKNIGIVFNATKEQDFELVKKYVKYLRAFGKKVKTIGYFDQKEIPGMVYSKVEHEYISNKDLNWYLKPLSFFIDEFIEQPYDILIDLNLDDDFALQYISSLSKAKFKIGKFASDADRFDMMIEMEQGQNLKLFLKHVDHYLMQLKPK